MSAAVVASLALGIAANTAVVSFVNAVQSKALPVHDEATLVHLSEANPTELCAGCAVGTSYPTYRDWKSGATSFAAMGAYREQRFVVAGPYVPAMGLRGRPYRGCAGLGGPVPVTRSPALGRGFSVEDDREGPEPVVMLSDLLWKSRFAADPDVVGRTLTVNGIVRTVVGRCGSPDRSSPDLGHRPRTGSASAWTGASLRSADW